MTSPFDATIWKTPLKIPRRGEETGVQLTERTKLRPLSITPDVDALGYDPFEDRPTQVHAQSWLALAKQESEAAPLLLEKKKNSWIDALPEAARAVLMAAAQPIDADAPRVAGAIAQPR